MNLDAELKNPDPGFGIRDKHPGPPLCLSVSSSNTALLESASFLKRTNASPVSLDTVLSKAKSSSSPVKTPESREPADAA